MRDYCSLQTLNTRGIPHETSHMCKVVVDCTVLKANVVSIKQEQFGIYTSADKIRYSKPTMYLQMSYWPQALCNIPLAMVKQLHISPIIYTKAKILWILNLSLYMHTHSNN